MSLKRGPAATPGNKDRYAICFRFQTEKTSTCDHRIGIYLITSVNCICIYVCVFVCVRVRARARVHVRISVFL